VLALEALLGSATKAANAVQDPAYGLFFNHWIDPRVRTKVTLDKINDGAQNTIMLSENIQASRWAPVDTTASAPLPPRPPRQFDVGFLWWSENVPPGTVTPGDGRMVNDEPKTPPANPRFLARPSSGHTGGAVVTYADGHSDFISEDVEYSIYQSLMAPEDSKAKKQGLVP